MLYRKEKAMKRFSFKFVLVAVGLSLMLLFAGAGHEIFAKTNTMGMINSGIDVTHGRYKGKVWGYQFSAILDNRTCFPKNTKIITQKGEKNINEVKVGDMVLTRKGFKKILATKKTEYKRKIYIICCKNVKVECTDNHPFWVIGKGWISTQNLKIGNEVINFGHNVISEIFNRVDFDFSNSQHMESFFAEKGISFDIPSVVSMPITSINFKT